MNPMMIPREFSAQFCVCFEECVSAPFETIWKMVQEELCDSHMSQSLSKLPLASGSICQVHLTNTYQTASPDNDCLHVMKIQHANARMNLHMDCIIIQYILHTVSNLMNTGVLRQLHTIAKLACKQELDLRTEVKNAEMLQELLNKSSVSDRLIGVVSVPEFVPSLCKERVSVQAYIHDAVSFRRENVEIMINDGISVENVIIDLCVIISELMFVHGYMHCDLHCGNILVRKSVQKNQHEIILIDHGLHHQIDSEMRVKVASLWAAIMTKDDAFINKFASSYGIPEEDIPFIITAISGVPASTDGESIHDGAGRAYIAAIMRIRAKLPSEFDIPLRVTDLLMNIQMSMSSGTQCATTRRRVLEILTLYASAGGGLLSMLRNKPASCVRGNSIESRTNTSTKTHDELLKCFMGF